MGFDECIKKLEEAAEYLKWAEVESTRCLDECHKATEAIARLQDNAAELRGALLCSKPNTN